MDITKKTRSKCWGGYGEKGALMYCWWEWRLIFRLWKTVWMLLKKNKNTTTIVIQQLHSLVYSQRRCNCYLELSAPHVHCNIIHSSQGMEVTTVHLWMNVYIYIYSGILSTHVKEGNGAIADMYGLWGHYAVWSHFYVESKRAELLKTESKMVVVRLPCMGETRRGWSKDTDFQL